MPFQTTSNVFFVFDRFYRPIGAKVVDILIKKREVDCYFGVSGALRRYLPFSEYFLISLGFF